MNATDTMNAQDAAGERARLQSDLCAARLRYFVEKWRPSDPAAGVAFQHDLMQVMMDALQSQNWHLRFGLEAFASDQFAIRAMAPLVVLRDPL